MENTFNLGNMKTAEFGDNTILFQIGLQKKKILFEYITGYYVYSFLGQDLFILAYTTGGTKKFLKIPMEKRAAKPFLERLKTAVPASANLLGEEKAAALKLLGTRDMTTVYVLVALGLIFVTVGALYSPSLWHVFFDNQLKETTIEDLYAGNLPDSGYVTFSARLGDTSQIINLRHIRSKQKDTRGYYPLLPPGWHQGQPIKVVLLADHNDLEILESRKGQTIQVTGLMRNILWEPIFPRGLTDIFYSRKELFSWQERLARKTQSPLESPILIDYQINPGSEIYYYLLIIICLGVVAGGGIVINHIQAGKNKKI